MLVKSRPDIGRRPSRSAGGWSPSLKAANWNVASPYAQALMHDSSKNIHGFSVEVYEGGVKNSKILFVVGAITALFGSQAFAAATTVQGKIIATQGHEAPACRTVTLKRNDNGATMYFRIPDTGVDNSILSITVTALAAHLNVDITYDPAITTGCGTEPKIVFISLIANP